MKINSGIKDTSAQDEVIVKKKSHSYLIKWFVVIVIGMVVTFSVWGRLSSIISGEKGISINQLNFTEVARGSIVRKVTVQGVVVAANSPTIFSTDSGIVKYAVKAGDKVNKGQVLTVIEAPELKNLLNQEKTRLIELKLAVERQEIDRKTLVRQAQQAIDIAEVDLRLVEKRIQRAKKSFDMELISKEEFEEREAEYGTAQVNHKHTLMNYESIKEQQGFELKARQVQLQRQELVFKDATRQVDDLTSYSPIEGVVGVTSFRDFHQVTENEALLTVIELGNYEVEVNIPEIFADELVQMLASEISVNGIKRDGYLAAISPEVVDGQVKGRLRFTGDSVGLRQNQRVSAEIVIESRNDVLKLKSGAYLASSGGRFVYVVKDEQAVKRTVNFGLKNAGEVEVLSGLDSGEIVITSNVEQFAQAKKIYLYK